MFDQLMFVFHVLGLHPCLLVITMSHPAAGQRWLTLLLMFSVAVIESHETFTDRL